MDKEKRKQRDLVRFWDKVDKRTELECWLWIAGKDNDGYGMFYVDGRTIKAHRYSMRIHLGRPLPTPTRKLDRGILVLHKCDIRACVNPNHLYLGNQRDNLADRDRKKRQSKGEHRYNSKLTEEDVRQIRTSYKPYKYGIKRLAKEYGVHYSTIYDVIRKKNWHHVS